MAKLFESPTIEQLANILREEASEKWSSLVAINANGSRPPLFVIHAGGGNVLFYRDLARQLGPDQPVYGLQSQGLDGKQTPYRRVEEMATHYIKEIKTIEPKGPYFFAGRCFGGFVAYEMAQQLHAQGEETALLAILDSGHPRLPWVSHLPKVPAQRSTAHYLQRGRHYLMNRQLGFALRDKWCLIADQAVKAYWKFRQQIRYLFPSPELRRKQQVEEANKEAAMSYLAQPYPGVITLIRSREFALRKSKDWHLRWSELAVGGLECHVVEGDHVTMMSDPNARPLAEQLSACVDAALARDWRAQELGMEAGANGSKAGWREAIGG